jgi:hypothetical protein
VVSVWVVTVETPAMSRRGRLLPRLLGAWTHILRFWFLREEEASVRIIVACLNKTEFEDDADSTNIVKTSIQDRNKPSSPSKLGIKSKMILPA